MQQPTITPESTAPNTIRLTLVAFGLAAIIFGLGVGVYMYLNGNRQPVSVTDPTAGQQTGYVDYESCFYGADTEMLYPEGADQAAICVTPDGRQFVEPKQSLDDRIVVQTDLYGPVEEWDVYRNEEYGFEFRYPSQRYEVVTEDYYWNPSVVLLRNRQSTQNALYEFAVEKPFAPNDDMARHQGEEWSRLVQTRQGPVAAVQIAPEDPFVPLIFESFRLLDE